MRLPVVGCVLLVWLAHVSTLFSEGGDAPFKQLRAWEIAPANPF